MMTIGASVPRFGQRFARNPLLVYWEITNACALACRHCRAEAMPYRNPVELTHQEGLNLLHQIAGFDTPLPHLVLTGGDPLARPDLFDLIDTARSLGIRVSVTPSATPALTKPVLQRLQSHGVQSIALSLDAATPRLHDSIRAVDGCFDWTLQALQDAETLGLPVQINTLVAAETLAELPALYAMLKQRRLMRWGLFFLIAVGRGRVLQPVSSEQAETLMDWIYTTAQLAPFEIKTTEAPWYRRVALERMRQEGRPPAAIRETSMYRGFGIRDGHGIVFIRNTGDVYPAGFLPATAGNVRDMDLVSIYRHSPLFHDLHTPASFTGKCGVCKYRVVCGGSRARAYAATGDPLASDPLCPYQPQAHEVDAPFALEEPCLK